MLALGGLVALAISGCGGAARADVTTAPGPPTPAQAAEVAAINHGLAVDQRAIAAYVAAGALLNGSNQKAAGWFLGQELSHAGVLRSLVAELGGVAHQPSSRYQLGHPSSAAEVLDLLQSIERQQIAAYASTIPRLDKSWLRTRLAAILGDDAQHLAVLDSLRGRPPPSTAFPVAATSAVAVADRPLISQLLDAELTATEVFGWALTSGRLSDGVQRLVSYLLAQEQAHVLVLTHALGRRYPPPAPEVSLDRVVTTIAVKMQSSQLRSQRGWVDLLQALTWRAPGAPLLRDHPRAARARFAAGGFDPGRRGGALGAAQRLRHTAARARGTRGAGARMASARDLAVAVRADSRAGSLRRRCGSHGTCTTRSSRTPARRRRTSAAA